MDVNLREARCRRLCKGDPVLSDGEADALLSRCPAWRREGDAIVRDCQFADFDALMAFINALADIARRQDHHPDVQFGYRECSLRFTTHVIGGLSENDFICAAQVDALLERRDEQ